MPGLKESISTLIGALQTHPVAKKLRSQALKGTIAGELASVFRRLDSDDCDLNPFLHLVELIVRDASDAEIWKAVLDLLSSFLRVTPPTSIPTSFGGTPRTYTSASQQDSEQTRRLVEPLLREELRDCCFVKVEGFFEKYFERKRWSKRSQEIFESIRYHLDFPSYPTEDAVWEWLSQFQKNNLCSDDVRGVYYTTSSKKDLTGSQAERQLDMFIKSRDAPSHDQHHWSDVRVIGEHKESADRAGKFFQLARYARDIFSAQPTRFFVHGFLLLGTTMELHIFDRSGAFSAAEFDILKEPERFIRVLAGYVLMSDEELGMDTFMKRQGNRNFVTLTDDDSQKERQLELEPQPIAMQPAIACRATCCYLTVDGKCVVKFSWQPDMRIPEVEYLRAAHKIKGVAQLVGHRRITSIGELRHGLVFHKKRQIHCRLDRTRSLFSQYQTASLPTANDSFREGKRQSEGGAEGQPRKKLRPNSQASRLSLEYRAANENTLEEMFKNRVLSCLAISPAGRPLDRFKSVPELLRALRDAVKAHQSLFRDAKILHRDISMNNIIITDRKDIDGFSGMLIDMDMATRIDENGNNECSGARNMTGTLKFMAIEVLRSAERDVQHTYRHDLESLFYVFLSICVSLGWPEKQRPYVNPLQSWYTLPYENIIAAKRGHMEKGGFEDIIVPRFSPTFECVKDLARSLRDIIFHTGVLYTGTPKDHSTLYTSMINAFNTAIDQIT